MSRPRYNWWGYVKWVIRDYPAKAKELGDMRTPKVTPSYAGRSGAAEPGRTPEELALRDFRGQKKREYEAVKAALASTSRRPDGAEIIRLIEMVFFRRTHTLQGAALACHCSERTAREWHRQFIRAVAREMGLLDD